MMTEQLPDIYSTPEKQPYATCTSTAPPKHVMKLIGSLYEPPKPAEEDAATQASDDSTEERRYVSRVMEHEEISAKKVRSVSARASHAENAMRATINECKGV